jgi:hypothetical protein
VNVQVLDTSVKMIAFRDVRLSVCSLVEVDRRFTDAYCLQHQGDLQHRCTSTRLHGATSQKGVLFIEEKKISR